MLKRTKILVAFLAVTVVCAAVGFAAVSDTLEIGGTVGLNVDETGALAEEFQANVIFKADGTVEGAQGTANTAPTMTGVTATRGADSATDENDKITVTIPATAFTAVGQQIKVTATIQNANTTKATLVYQTITNDLSDYVNITTNWSTNSAEVAATGETNIVVTLTLTQVPATADSGDFSFTITATPVVTQA